jgi:phosphoglycolate phosphatase-like HAD superfamily hydrolase
LAPDPHLLLKNFNPQHKFFVAIDSDGCVFNNMEIKQKECFIPMIVKHWHLEAISKYVRETAEFVNLYSIWRGANRFPALVRIFNLLREHPEVIKRQINLPDVSKLREFINSGLPLSNPSLAKWIQQTPHPFLQQTLNWSLTVNQLVDDKIQNISPFARVREVLERLSPMADLIVCSSTTVETLQKEWQAHKLGRYMTLIAGQEMGTKKEHLELAAVGKYAPDKILMIGDAPGDKKAAQATHILFYPIHPGNEEKSWEIFQQEALSSFLKGTYAGTYQAQLISKFDKLLPEYPPWG